jgi:hypothetical protein
LFEEFSDHSDFGAMVGEGGPFVVSYVRLGFTLYLPSQFGYELDREFIVVCFISYILPFCLSLFI